MGRKADKKKNSPARIRVKRSRVVLVKAKAGSNLGAVERLHTKILRAWHLRSEGLFYHEIAKIIGEEFNEKPVSQKCIMEWLDKYKEEFFKEIKEFQARSRMEQYMQMERMKRKFLPIACLDELHVKRHVKAGEEGVIQVIDENAFEEQRKASETVIKIMQRQANLMGLDLTKARNEEEGPIHSLLDLQIWITNQVNPAIQMPGEKKAPGRTLETLELESGHPGEEL